jgi:hypothetical protein
LYINGPDLLCAGDTGIYSSEAPIIDSCQWAINGIPWESGDCEVDIVWEEPGIFWLTLAFVNSSGYPGVVDSLLVEVMDVPPPPDLITGDTLTCTGDSNTYSTSVGPGEYCEWKFNGEPLGMTECSILLEFTSPGINLIEVRAGNICGLSEPVFIEVEVDYYPEVTLGNDTTILQGQVLVLDAGNPGASYLWNTGDTTRLLSVSNAGQYSVTATTFCGSDADTLNVNVIVSIEEKPYAAEAKVILFGTTIKVFTPEIIQRLSLYDANGRIVAVNTSGNDITAPRPGFYVIGIESDKSVFRRKIMIP